MKFYNPALYTPPAKREVTEAERITLSMGGTLAPTAPPAGIAGTGIATAFLQLSADKEAPPPPPETFGAYAKQSETNNGVVAMIDLLLKDLEKEMTEATAEEKDAQGDYEEFISGSAAKRAEDSKSLTDKTAAKADLEAQLEEQKATKTSTGQELAATLEYIASLHAECDWLVQYYGVRKEARASEIDALGKAKAVLSGADYSLVQTVSKRSLLSSGASVASSTDAVARVWLQEHQAPQADELEELRQANPDAYAIVKALLTKRSLGLLDPRHPTASFAGAKPVDTASQPSGAAAFAKFETPAEQAKLTPDAAPAPYPDAPVASAPHDFWNWKPADSATSDDAMVQNVLGAVSQIAGGKKGALLGKAQAASTKPGLSSLDQDADLFGADTTQQQQPASQPAPTAAQPASQGNSYLAAVDFSDELKKANAPAVPSPPAGNNPYLKGLDLGSDAAVSDKGPNALASFSFDDNAAPVASAAQKTVTVKKAAPSALDKFLR